LIRGSSLLATGGGGSIDSAQKMIKRLKKKVRLVDLNELDKRDAVVTVFGVGGKEKNDPVVSVRFALAAFMKYANISPSAIIPVEVGPLAVATACFMASELKLPVLNADIVGFRSSPEVFIETISIPELPREPLAAANEKGETIILTKSTSIQTTEQILRNFATVSGGDAHVVGYPLNVRDIENVVGVNSISSSIAIGIALNKVQDNSLVTFCTNNNFVVLANGIITRQKTAVKSGFTQGDVEIVDQSKNRWTIVIKNENMAALKNNNVVITIPDSICLLDMDTKTGINNFEKNVGKQVAILARRAIPIWRTKRGKALFSPKNLGLSIEQKLLR